MKLSLYFAVYTVAALVMFVTFMLVLPFNQGWLVMALAGASAWSTYRARQLYRRDTGRA